MTGADLAELDLLLAQYQLALATRHPSTIARRRKPLETALVRHARELIDAAKARQPGIPLAETRAGAADG
jgi:hypothetical protein